MANLKLFLVSLYEKDAHDFLYGLPYELTFKSLPIAKAGEGFDDDSEYVDFENYEILSINMNTNTIDFVAGGDWQLPTEFSVTLKDDGEFHYNNDAIQDANYRDGLSKNEILRILGIKND
jgi:hypothetical protein